MYAFAECTVCTTYCVNCHSTIGTVLPKRKANKKENKVEYLYGFVKDKLLGLIVVQVQKLALCEVY